MSFFSQVEKAIEREFRRWTEKVFGPAESDELLVVHRAILEDVEGKIQTVQRGRKLFPYNRLRVHLVRDDIPRIGSRSVGGGSLCGDRQFSEFLPEMPA